MCNRLYYAGDIRMIKEFIQRFRADTPKRWKFVRNTAILIGGSIAAGSLIVPLNDMPDFIKYIAFSCGALAFFAQQKEAKK